MWSTLEKSTLIGLLVLGVKGSYGSAVSHHYSYSNISSAYSHVVSSVWSTTTPYTTTTLPHTNITTTTKCTTTTSVQLTTSTHLTAASCNSTSLTTSTIKISTVPTITSHASYPTYTYPSSTVVEACPTSCSVYAGTVELFFWPTNNDYSYPATFVDTALDYTFTSPSVYMVINTIFGTNSLGTVGPDATSIVFALDLDEVSTIVPGSQATRQLSLSDLGTDCPHTAEPSAILTMTDDGRCDPSLVAPDVVKSWAYPCGACGKFGLFDPPYAIPTLPGGILGTETVTEVATATPVTSTVATLAATGATATVATPTSIHTTEMTTATSATSSIFTSLSSTTSATTVVATASGTRVTSEIVGLVLGLSLAVLW